jgi:acyl carrier protein
MTRRDGDLFLPALKAFIVNELLDGEDADFNEFTPLLEWGIIDSISMVRLLVFVDSQFGINVDQAAVTAPDVMNLAAFANLLARAGRNVNARPAPSADSEVV